MIRKDNIINKILIIENLETKELTYWTSLKAFCRVNSFPIACVRRTDKKYKEKKKKNKKIRYNEHYNHYAIHSYIKGEYIFVPCGQEKEYAHCIYIEDLETYVTLKEVPKHINKYENKKEEKPLRLNGILDVDNIIEQNEEEKVNNNYLLKKYQRLQKQYQNKLDENTLLRKMVRDDTRIERGIEELTQSVLESVKNISPTEFPSLFFPKPSENNIGMLVLSDLHIGKIVNIGSNKFNLDIAKKRIENLVKQVHKEILINNITRLHIFMLGDMIHMQSRRDMVHTAEFVEMECGIHCFDLIKNMINQLLGLKILLKIEVHNVVGNESRIDGLQPHTNIPEIARNSYDFMITKLLQIYFNDSDSRVKVHPIQNAFEKVVTVGEDYNILLIHSDKIRHNNLDTEVSKLKLRIGQEYRKHIDYVLFGHIHSTLITDLYARNSSLVGADEYATIGLNIPESMVSQLFGVYDTTDKTFKVFSMKV